MMQTFVYGYLEGFAGRDECADEGEAELGDLIVVSVWVVGGFLVFFFGGVGQPGH